MRSAHHLWIVGSSLLLVVAGSVPAASPPIPLTDEQVEKLWNALGDHSIKANDAIWSLAAAPEQASHLARRKLLPVQRSNTQQTERWVAELDDSRFVVRQQATDRLKDMGRLALPALRRVRIEECSLEQRRRVEHLMQECEQKQDTPEHWRALGLILALQHAGTPETRRLLQIVAEGPEGTDVTEAAQRALKRMKER